MITGEIVLLSTLTLTLIAVIGMGMAYLHSAVTTVQTVNDELANHNAQSHRNFQLRKYINRSKIKTRMKKVVKYWTIAK